jgi:hypothetical protein
MYSEWRIKKGNNAKWSCICNYSCYTNPGPFDSHARCEEGSMAYRRPSFGPSDKSHMYEYDI